MVGVGDNFGFDMIVADGGGNVGEAKERQETLVRVERYLSAYQPGNPKGLGEIFAEFLKA